MSAPDPKPRKRIRDKRLMRELHTRFRYEPCDHCGIRRGTQLHHVVRRSQGGDDARENLRWLCIYCHNAIHS